MRPVPILLACAAAATTALAETPPAVCDTQKNMAEMESCAAWHLGEAEHDLGLALAELRRRDPLATALLDDAQAAWSHFRDRHCYFVGFGDGIGVGSEWKLNEISCKTALTQTRAADLRALLHT